MIHLGAIVEEKMVRILFIAAVAGGIFFAARPTMAQDKAEAEKHFKAGLTLQKADDFDAAAAAFEKSISLYATKGGLYNLANCYRALHRKVTEFIKDCPTLIFLHFEKQMISICPRKVRDHLIYLQSTLSMVFMKQKT